MTVGVAALVMIVAGWSDGGSPTELEARFRREYPAAAARWNALSDDVLVRGRTDLRFMHGTKHTTQALTVAASGSKRLVHRDRMIVELASEPGHPYEAAEVFCETPAEMFRLTKSSRNRTLGYIIRYHGPFEDDPTSELMYHFQRFAQCATVYYGISLLDRVRDPSFVLKSIEAHQEAGRERVRINYSFESKNYDESGWVELEPDLDWAIRAVRVEHVFRDEKHSSAGLEVSVEYDTFGTTHPWPRHAEIHEPYLKSGVYEHMVLDVDQVQFGNIPDSMFRLSAFGLPDVPVYAAPRQTAFRWSNPLLWISLAGVIGSFVILRALRRSARVGGLEGSR